MPPEPLGEEEHPTFDAEQSFLALDEQFLFP
jgi:hypothetical protein